MTRKCLLLIDRDDVRRSLLTFGLRCAQLRVDESSDAAAALESMSQHCPELLLISASTLEADLGAPEAKHWDIDDYLLQPIAPEELVDRVRAGFACRSREHRPTAIAGLSIDDESGVVRRGTRCASLGPAERRLLEFFMASPGRCCLVTCSAFASGDATRTAAWWT